MRPQPTMATPGTWLSRHAAVRSSNALPAGAASRPRRTPKPASRPPFLPPIASPAFAGAQRIRAATSPSHPRGTSNQMAEAALPAAVRAAAPRRPIRPPKRAEASPPGIMSSPCCGSCWRRSVRGAAASLMTTGLILLACRTYVTQCDRPPTFASERVALPGLRRWSEPHQGPSWGKRVGHQPPWTERVFDSEPPISAVQEFG
jgi:hypothetical protein